MLKAERQEVKNECVKRMKMLKLHPNVINEFINENKLNKSDGPLGTLYWLTEEEQERVKRIEEKYNVLVYHVIHTYSSNLGELYDLLFITNDKIEWKYDRQDLEKEIMFSRTEVVEDVINSEFGCIGIEIKNGGVVRIC